MRISELPVASTLGTTEQFAVVQAGETRRATTSQVLATAQPLDPDLTALAALVATGLVARTAPATFAGRTLQSGTGVVITNGDGVSGNPSIAIGQAVGTSDSPQFNNMTATGVVTLTSNSAPNTLIITRTSAPSGGTPSVLPEIVVNSADSNQGVEFLGTPTTAQQILFSDTAVEGAGRVRYTHSDDTMSLWTGAGQRLSLSGTMVRVFRPIELQPYGVTSVPAAGANRLAMVDDEGGGTTVAFADGTNWRRISDRQIVSAENIVNDPRDSAIINGSCVVSSRASANLTATYAYGPVDLWAVRADGTPTAGTISQNASTALETASGYGLRVSGASAGAGGAIFFRHRIESREARRFISRPAILSLIVHHDVGSNINWVLTVNRANATDNFGAVTQIATNTTAVPSGSRTRLSLTISDMTANAANGVEVIIEADCGSITTRAFEIGDVQLTVGTAQPSFKMLPEGAERAAVNRYLQIISGVVGKANSASAMQVAVSHPGMRAAPSYTATGALDFTDAVAADFSQSQASVDAIQENTADHGRITLGFFSGMTSGTLMLQRGTGDVILASAEL